MVVKALLNIECITEDQSVILRWQPLTLCTTLILLAMHVLICYFCFGMFDPELSGPVA
jgi:hypothetical protein